MTISGFLSRRTMLQASGLGVAALTIPVPSSWSAAPTAPGRAPLHLRRSSYEGFIGTRFTTGGTALTLTGVDDLPAASRRPELRDHDEAFVATFSGPSDPVLASGMHELAHPEHGSATLFISPVSEPGAGRQQYEVTVDRTILVPGMLFAPDPVISAPAPSAPAGATPVAGAAAAAAALGAPAPASSARRRVAKRMRVRTAARRSGRRVRIEVRFLGGGVTATRVELRRKGRTYARGTAVARRNVARLDLRRRRVIKRGNYDLVLTVTDRKGGVTTTTRTVKVR